MIRFYTFNLLVISVFSAFSAFLNLKVFSFFLRPFRFQNIDFLKLGGLFDLFDFFDIFDILAFSLFDYIGCFVILFFLFFIFRFYRLFISRFFRFSAFPAFRLFGFFDFTFSAFLFFESRLYKKAQPLDFETGHLAEKANPIFTKTMSALNGTLYDILTSGAISKH